MRAQIHPESLTIGDMARQTDVKVVTIRYYETIGLLPAPGRTHGNYRAYTPQHLERLNFIRRCRDLGFTLDQIRDLLALSEEQGRNCCEVDIIARTHLADVERKAADLSRLAQELRRIVKQCRGGTVGACRVIEALSDDQRLTSPRKPKRGITRSIIPP